MGNRVPPERRFRRVCYKATKWIFASRIKFRIELDEFAAALERI